MINQQFKGIQDNINSQHLLSVSSVLNTLHEFSFLILRYSMCLVLLLFLFQNQEIDSQVNQSHITNHLSGTVTLCNFLGLYNLLPCVAKQKWVIVSGENREIKDTGLILKKVLTLLDAIEKIRRVLARDESKHHLKTSPFISYINCFFFIGYIKNAQ